MAEPIRHVTSHMRFDLQIDAARKHKGWVTFHRECGRAGLFFDAIEKQGRGYSAISFRMEKSGENWTSYRVSKGSGSGVIEAVLSAFDGAVGAGFAIDVRLRLPLAGEPVSGLDALLGAPTTPLDEIMDLIG